MNENFFKALSHVQQIHSNCKVLLRTHHQVISCVPSLSTRIFFNLWRPTLFHLLNGKTYNYHFECCVVNGMMKMFIVWSIVHDTSEYIVLVNLRNSEFIV